MELRAELNSAAKFPFRGRTQPSQQATLLQCMWNVFGKKKRNEKRNVQQSQPCRVLAFSFFFSDRSNTATHKRQATFDHPQNVRRSHEPT